MNRIILIFIAVLGLVFARNNNYSQNLNNFNFQKNSPSSVHHISSQSGFTNSLILSSLLVISPTLVLEDSKSHFGLSKELSAGKYPYGRAELDYTYIFRSERTSTIHFSYNFDVPLNGNFSSPSLFFISPGTGYYTDFTRKGIFAQLSIGILAATGFSNAVSIHPNLKFRKVFIKDNFPGVFEISLGVGFGIYSR